jgi:hypothetical protein
MIIKRFSWKIFKLKRNKDNMKQNEFEKQKSWFNHFQKESKMMKNQKKIKKILSFLKISHSTLIFYVKNDFILIFDQKKKLNN